MQIHLPKPLITDPEIQGNLNGTIAGMLVLLSLLASFASFPLQYHQASQLAANTDTPLPSYAVLLISSVIIGLIVNIIIIALGLSCSPKAGLGTPLLNSLLLKNQSGAKITPLLITSITTGIILGIVLFVLGVSIDNLASIPAPAITRPTPLQFLLASIGAGLNEEIWLRLGAMTILVFLVMKIPFTQQHRSMAVWIGNILAAIIFGLIHLPQAQSLVGLGPVIVVSVLCLNTLGGVVYGWIYWRYGLMMAMLTHFCTDIILHVVGPAIM